MSDTSTLHPPSAPTVTLVEAWFTPRRFALALAVLIAIAFPDVLLGVKSFYYRDFGLFGYPLAFYHRECFWRGELPLWNPLNNCGLPFLAQWNTMVLYPGTFIYLLFPLPWSLSVFCLGHQWLAGVGMYYLARRWTGSGWAAAMAGLVYAFNGLTLNSLMWPNNIAALGWLPWVVFVTERAWQKGGRQTIMAASIGALQMLTGAPEIILFTWLMVAGLWAATNVKWSRCYLVVPVPHCQPRVFLRLITVGLLIGGLSAIQLIPFVDLLRYSQRDTHFASAAWSMPGTGWANLLIPVFHCFSGTQGVFFQYEQWWTSSYYVGTATLIVAAGACWRLRSRQIAWLVLVALLGLLLPLGENGGLYPLLKTLFPALGFVRFPVKFVVLLVFALPLIMAFGLRHLTLPYPQRPPLTQRWLWSAGLGACGIIGLLLAFVWRFPMTWNDWPVTAHNALQRVAWLVVMLAALHALGRAETVRTRALVAVAFGIFLWMDLLTHAPWQNPTIPPAGLAPGLIKLTPQPRVGQSRAMVSPEAYYAFRNTQVSDALNHYLGYRLGLICNCNLLDDIPTASGFYSLYLKEAEAVTMLVYSQTNLATKTGLLDFLGVSQVTKAGSMLDWTFRPSFLPLVTAGQKPEFLDEAPTMRALASAAFQPTNVVFLPKEAQTHVRAREQAPARLRIEHQDNHRFVVHVETPSPTMVVVAQAYHGNWQARVDDRPVALWRANYAYQAVEVPAGSHRVELRYQDRALRTGAWVSVAALGMTLAGWFWRRGARK